MLYSLAADAIVVAHLIYVSFVIFGLVLILLGRALGWAWVRNSWFRVIHLSMIMIVVVESLYSITCPLTTLEDYLRQQAGQTVQEGSFIGRMAHHLLFVDIPPQSFVWIYCLFGLLVLTSWVIVPPNCLGRIRSRLKPGVVRGVD